MTVKETLTELNFALGEIYDQVFYDDKPYEFDADGYEALRIAFESLKQNQWIPCSERLPREDELILVNVIRTDRIYPIILCIGKDAYAMAEHGDINAWMPLPKAYEGRTE